MFSINNFLGKCFSPVRKQHIQFIKILKQQFSMKIYIAGCKSTLTGHENISLKPLDRLKDSLEKLNHQVVGSTLLPYEQDAQFKNNISN
jgi:hypothetical protein